MATRIDLQEFLPYLMNRAGLRIGVMFSRDIEQFNITLPMWRVMIELSRRGNHRLNELSQHTSIDISTLSRLVVIMQRKKLIIRKRSGLDGRALSLSLTAYGRRLTRKIIPYALRYEEIAMRGIDDREGAMLKDLLKRIYRNLETANRDNSTRSPKARSRTKRQFEHDR